MDINLEKILNLLSQAKTIMDMADQAMDTFKDAGVVLASDSEEKIEAAIAELEASLPALRESVQNKLRGN